MTALSEICVCGGGPRSITTRLRHSETLGHSVALSEGAFGTCEFAVCEHTAGEGGPPLPLAVCHRLLLCQHGAAASAHQGSQPEMLVAVHVSSPAVISSLNSVLSEWPWIWRLGFKHHPKKQAGNRHLSLFSPIFKLKMPVLHLKRI